MYVLHLHPGILSNSALNWLLSRLKCMIRRSRAYTAAARHSKLLFWNQTCTWASYKSYSNYLPSCWQWHYTHPNSLFKPEQFPRVFKLAGRKWAVLKVVTPFFAVRLPTCQECRKQLDTVTQLLTLSPHESFLDLQNKMIIINCRNTSLFLQDLQWFSLQPKEVGR